MCFVAVALLLPVVVASYLLFVQEPQHNSIFVEGGLNIPRKSSLADFWGRSLLTRLIHCLFGIDPVPLASPVLLRRNANFELHNTKSNGQ